MAFLVLYSILAIMISNHLTLGGYTLMSQDNIILITTDQQRFDTIQALGNTSIFTPHLNYLASEGITYTNCYADCPVCVPSRTTIMTGKAGYESGIVGNQDHTEFMSKMAQSNMTLPARLTSHGYQTRAVGKMHFQPPRSHYGFEHMLLPLDYMRKYDKQVPLARPKIHGIGECSVVPVISTVDTKDSMTTWTVDESIDFLETRDSSRPFFLWSSFTKPHPPFDPTRDFWDLYENIQFPEPVYGDWSMDLEKAPQGFLAGTYSHTDMYLQSPAQIQSIRRAYYAMISEVDYSLGMLLASLREQNLFSNTWIVFTTDHGEMLGDHHMAQKNLFFEGASHIPLIVIPPKRKEFQALRNKKVDKLVTLTDLYPTMMKMAQIDTSKDGNTGINLLDEITVNRSFYGTTNNDQFCILKDNYKLLYSRCGNHYLLFHLKDDPMEQHNLWNHPNYKEKQEELQKLLLEHVAQYQPELLESGSLIPTEEPKFPGDVPSRWLGFHYKDYGVDTFH